MATVTIIGAGMMGSALAFPARENGHEWQAKIQDRNNGNGCPICRKSTKR